MPSYTGRSLIGLIFKQTGKKVHKSIYRPLGLAAALFAALLFSGATNAQQWYSVGLNASGDHWLIDTDRIKFDGNVARFWIRQDFKDLQWASGISTGLGGMLAGALKSKVAVSLELYQVDCDRMSGSVLSRIRQSESGEAIDNATFDAGTPVTYPPGSMGTRVLDFVCKRGKELAKKEDSWVLIPDPVRSARWKQASSNQTTKFFVAEDMISQGTGDLAGVRLFYQKSVFNTTYKFGQFVIAENIYAYTTKCGVKEATLLGDAAYAIDGRLLYRSEYLDSKPMTFNPGSVGYQVLDEVCNITIKSAEKPVATQTASSDKPTPTSMSTGTAWLSSSGYFVTAYHVIADTNSLVLYGTDKQPHPARVIAADEKNDVALIWADLKGKPVRPIPFAKGATALGSRVFTIGYPHSDLLGVSPKVTSGEVSGTLPLDPTKVLISVPVQSGNSGGPLINMNGEAVGLVIQKLSAPKVFKETGDLTENTNFALRVKYVDALIDDQPKIETEVGFPKVKGTQLEDWVAAYKDSVFFVMGTNSKPSK